MKRLALSLALPALLLCFVALEAGTAVAQTQLQITNGPVVEGVGDTWAVVSWTTNTGGSSIVRYGTSPNNLTQTAEAPYSQGNSSQNHRVRINNLQPNTTYYFTADSGQGEGTGTGAGTAVQTFHTNPAGTATSNYPGSNQQQGSYPQGYYPGQTSQAIAITYGPQVVNVTPNSAVVNWTTSAGGSSVVQYGTAPNAINQTAEAPYTGNGQHGQNGQEIQHSVRLNNLQPNTTYYFFVDSGQGSGTGTGTSSQIMQFRTPA
jgi:Purple acid Phosphatase, N-terminal domain